MTISPILPVYARADLTLDHGEGAYVYTKEGDKYLDFLSGIVTVDDAMIALIDLPHLLSAASTSEAA